MRSPRSEPSTAPGSPHESDDEVEADVDYDDVLAVVGTRHGSNMPRKRAGRSYSDLNHLKAQVSPETTMSSMADYTMATEDPDENLHHRKPYRSNGNGPSDALGLDKGE